MYIYAAVLTCKLSFIAVIIAFMPEERPLRRKMIVSIACSLSLFIKEVSRSLPAEGPRIYQPLRAAKAHAFSKSDFQPFGWLPISLARRGDVNGTELYKISPVGASRWASTADARRSQEGVPLLFETYEHAAAVDAREWASPGRRHAVR